MHIWRYPYTVSGTFVGSALGAAINGHRGAFVGALVGAVTGNAIGVQTGDASANVLQHWYEMAYQQCWAYQMNPQQTSYPANPVTSVSPVPSSSYERR